MKNRFLLAALCLTVAVAGCKTQQTSTSTAKPAPKATAPATDCTTQVLAYNAHIKPIIDTNCASTCHSATKRAKGIDLSTYAQVKEAAAKPSFLGSIKHETGFAAMPKMHPKMDDVTIGKISCWIQNGMVE
jgi:hypothetical protein